MADNNDKPNNSKKPINGKMPQYIEGAFESRAQDIGNITERRDVYSAQQRLGELEEKAKSTTDIQEVIKAQENISWAEWDLHKAQEEAAASINRQYADIITTRIKSENVNTRTTAMAGEHRFYSRAKKDPGIFRATEEIESSIVQRQEEISLRGSTLAGRIMGLGEEEPTPGMVAEAKAIGALEEETAYEKKLLRVQNKAGLSTEKMFGRAEEIMARTDRYFETEGLTERVRKREVRTIGEETEDLGMKQRDVFLAQESYDSALESGTENMAEFGKALKDATEALDKQQKLVDAMNHQKVSGPGGRFTYGPKARAALGIAGIAANTAATIGLDYEIEQTQQRTAFANMANRQYQNVDKFLGGDMSAFLELSKGDKFRKEYSDRLRSRAVTLKGAEAIAAGVDAGAEALAAKGEVAAFWNPDVGGALDKAVGAAGKVGRATKMGARLGFGIEQGAVGLKAAQSAEALAAAINTIPADVMQNYFDVKRGAFDAGVGLGYQRNVMMTDMTSRANMAQFARAGMTPQQAIQAAGMAVPNVGVTEDYSDMVLRAGRAQQRGILGIGDYMANVGQLANVGGGSADIESIMSKAITAGMENAKNINQMVQATTTMAASSAAIGISTTGATSNMLAASIQSMRSMGVNRNIAADAAADALGAAAEAGKRMGTFADLRYRAKMRDIYGGDFDLGMQLSMRQIDQPLMQEILSGAEQGRIFMERSGLAEKVGYDVTTGKFKSPEARSDFEKIRRALVEKEVIDQMGTSAALSNINAVDEVVGARLGEKNPDELSQKARRWFYGTTGKLAGAVNYAEAEEVKFYDPDKPMSEQGPLRPRPRGTSEVEALKEQDIFKGKRIGEKVVEGEEAFKDVGGLPGLVEAMKVAMEAATPEKMQEAVSKAATDLKAPADIFSTSTTRFDGAVTAFINGLSKMGVSVPTVETKESNTNKVPREAWRGNSGGTVKKQ